MKIYRELTAFLRKKYFNYKIKQLIGESTDDAQQEIYTTLLQNGLAYLEQNRAVTMNEAVNLPTFFYLRLLKRVIDKVLVLREIIGIQPMAAAVGLVYSMKVSLQAQEVTDEYQGTTAVCSNYYRLSLVSSVTSAKARKIGTQISVNSIVGKSISDLENEIIDVVSSEVAGEIVEFIVKDLVQEVAAGELQLTIDVGDAPSLFTALNQLAADIGDRSRRGRGNFVVLSSVDLLKLKDATSLGGLEFEPTDVDLLEQTALVHAGDLYYGTKQVYKVFESRAVKGQVLVGFRGTTEVDVGYIYSPYQILMPSILIDQETLSPTLSMITRAGTLVSSLNYYALIKENLT